MRKKEYFEIEGQDNFEEDCMMLKGNQGSSKKKKRKQKKKYRETSRFSREESRNSIWDRKKRNYFVVGIIALIILLGSSGKILGREKIEKEKGIKRKIIDRK